MTTFWMIIAILVLVGILLFKRWVDRQPDLTPEQVADVIDRFVDGNNSEDFAYEWDDYIHIPSRNPALEQIRRECEEVADKFPPERKTEWCSTEGRVELKRLAQKARELAQQSAAPLPSAPVGPSEGAR
jgi:hypothetical protein